MTTPRRPAVLTTYNGANITADLKPYQTSFSYSDPGDGQADNVSLTLADPDGRWAGAWAPKKGDTISSVIKTENSELDCGKMLVDDVSYSGPPDKVSIAAKSAPANTELQDTARSQTWEAVTIEAIAAEIAGRYGLTLVYDADEVTIAAAEQSNASDGSFLQSLCSTYYLCLKIYSEKLVIYGKDAYKRKEPVAEISKSDCVSYGYKSTLTGVYTGGRLTYTDPSAGADVEFAVGTKDKELAVSGSASSEADAERIVVAAVDKANDGETTMSLTLPGSTFYTAGQTVRLKGFGDCMNGKYFIASVSHSVGGGYTTKLSLELVRDSIGG